MTGVVLDTNVVVSGFLNPEGAEANVLRLALHGHYTLYISDLILEEYEGVLRRPKFKRPTALVTALLTGIRKSSVLVTPSRTLSVSRDEADNRFLETAETAEADYLVTGNKRHFPKRWGKTEVVTARELIDRTMPPESR